MDTSSYHFRSRRPDQAGLEALIEAICETRVRYPTLADRRKCRLFGPIPPTGFDHRSLSTRLLFDLVPGRLSTVEGQADATLQALEP